MKKNKKLIFGFIAVIAISLLPRLDMFSSTVRNDEWNSATVLRHLEIWDMSSAFAYSFNPVLTYPGAANKNIDNNSANTEDSLAFIGSDDNYYYTSYPQFGYIFPYLYFKLFRLNINIFNLRVFTVLLQIIAALLVYAIVFRITREKVSAFVGFSAYMFLPLSLHANTFNYMSDMLAPLISLCVAYFFIRIVLDAKPRKSAYILFIISLFLLIYTEYIGLFTAGIVFLYGIWNMKKKHAHARFFIWTSVLTTIAAVTWTVYQYTLTNDLSYFLNILVNRYSDVYHTGTRLDEILRVKDGYYRWYRSALILILVLYIGRLLAFNFKKQDEDLEIDAASSRFQIAALTLFFPALIHHGLLLYWTGYHAYTFSLFKDVPMFCICIAYMYWVLAYKMKTSDPKLLKNLVNATLVFFALWSISIFADNKYVSMFPYSYCETGEYMNEHTGPDQVIFVKDEQKKAHHFPINPVIVYCSKRNLAIYENRIKANHLMQKNGEASANIFTLEYVDGSGAPVTSDDNGAGVYVYRNATIQTAMPR